MVCEVNEKYKMKMYEHDEPTAFHSIEDNAVRRRQTNLNSACQLVCVKNKVKVFVLKDNDDKTMMMTPGLWQ